jgi:hypothetical protein
MFCKKLIFAHKSTLAEIPTDDLRDNASLQSYAHAVSAHAPKPAFGAAAGSQWAFEPTSSRQGRVCGVF